MDNDKITRVAKNLDIFANVAGKVAAAAGIVSLAAAALLLIFGRNMLDPSSIKLNLDFAVLHLGESAPVNERFFSLYAVSSALGAGILCFLVSYVCKLIRAILSPMKNGRPFEAGISDNIKKVAWAVLIGGLVSELMGVAARVMLIKAFRVDELFAATAAVAKTEYAFTIDLGFALFACVLFFLSYVFAYGRMLQQESDETL